MKTIGKQDLIVTKQVVKVRKEIDKNLNKLYDTCNKSKDQLDTLHGYIQQKEQLKIDLKLYQDFITKKISWYGIIIICFVLLIRQVSFF